MQVTIVMANFTPMLDLSLSPLPAPFLLVLLLLFLSLSPPPFSLSSPLPPSHSLTLNAWLLKATVTGYKSAAPCLPLSPRLRKRKGTYRGRRLRGVPEQLAQPRPCGYHSVLL